MVIFCNKCGKAVLPSQINKNTHEVQCVCGNWILISAKEYILNYTINKSQLEPTNDEKINVYIDNQPPLHCPYCSNELYLIDRNQDFLIRCSTFPNCHFIAKIRDPNNLICPICKRKLSFFNVKRELVLGCSGYPICKFMIKTCLSEKVSNLTKPRLTTRSNSIKKEQDKNEKIPEKCPECGSGFQLRQGPYGSFLGCRSYPKCTFTFNIPDPDDIKCPLCQSKMTKRTGKYGTFLGCSNYPQCRHTINIKKASKKKTIKRLDSNSEIQVLSNNLITSSLSFDWSSESDLLYKLKIYDKTDANYFKYKLKNLESKFLIQKKTFEGKRFWRLTQKSID